MAYTIFYSWQSDISKKINRNFIEEALKKAIKALGKNIEVQDALRDEGIEIDKDTKGVPGIPPIVDTIFKKISNCGIFLPDLTFVGKTESGRFLSNPNVLVEYGWALRELTHARIIPVMNSAFGEPSWEALPFDMRHLRRPLTYRLTEDVSNGERSKIKTELSKKLTDAIEMIIKEEPKKKTVTVQNEYRGILSTTNPSTFLSPDETFLATDRFSITQKEIYLPDNQHYFLRLIPSIPVVSIKSSKRALDLAQSGNLMPLCKGSAGLSFERNKHGSYVYILDNDKILNLTQLFLTGELWGIDAYSIDKDSIMEWSSVDFGYFPCTDLENTFICTLTNYLKFASKTLKLKLPLRLIAGATNVKGYKMPMLPGYISLAGRFDGHVYEDDIVYEEVIESYSTKASDILLPFFKYVWEACGLERPDKEALG